MGALEFTIPGEPVGKGRPRFNGETGRTYTPAKTVNYENLVKLCFRQAYPNHEPFAKKVPLGVEIFAHFKIPKSASKRKAEDMFDQIIRPTKKPDCDNIAKAVLDALNGLAYYDDSQVVQVYVYKRYSYTPHVEVVITEAEI